MMPGNGRGRLSGEQAASNSNGPAKDLDGHRSPEAAEPADAVTRVTPKTPAERAREYRKRKRDAGGLTSDAAREFLNAVPDPRTLMPTIELHELGGAS
jgi:hypothetical protein